MFRILCIATSFFLIAGPGFGAAKTSLVVLPLHDGTADEASDKTAAVLRDKLSETAALDVIEPGKVEAILSYYRDFNRSSDDPQTAEAKDLLARAKEHYFQFAYAEAESELKKAVSTAEGGLLQEALVTLALVYAAQKAKSESVETFKQALLLNPLYRLDSKNFAPSIHKLFTQALEETKKLPSGNLEIGSNPKVTDVYLNGGYIGVTPQVLSSIPAGEYRVLLKANRYGSVGQTAIVKEGETKTVFGKLYWGGPEKNTIASQEDSSRARRQIEEGVRAADLLKTDKALLVNVDVTALTLRLVDRHYRAGHNPIVIPLNGDADRLADHLDQSVRFILAQTELNLLKNPTAYLDPDGVGDPILLGKQARKRLPKGVWIGGLSALGAGGLLAGILAASAGGSSPGTGTMSVNFK